MSYNQVSSGVSFYPGLGKSQWSSLSQVYGMPFSQNCCGPDITSLLLMQMMSNTFNNVLGGQSCCCCCCSQQINHCMPRRIEEDPYGVGQCGQGYRSNLANSPEALLALNDIFKSGGNKSYDDVAKELKEKYGIQAEVADIKTVDKDGKEATRKGISFANGDYFVDSNGDNQLGTGDYKFTEAIDNLKEKYGVDDKYLNKYVDFMKERGSTMNEMQSGGGNFGGSSFNNGASQQLMMLMMLMFMQSYNMAN